MATGAIEVPNGSVRLEELERLPPRVTITPAPSIFVIAADVAGAGRGVPTEWIERARAELEPQDMAALAPIGSPRGHGIPDLATISSTLDPSVTVADRLEHLATLPAESLLEQLGSTWSTSPLWTDVARRPRHWLVLYARALARVWNGIREPWAQAAALLDREIERVETAVAHRALPELMGDIHERASVENGLWRLDLPETQPLRLPERGIELAPVLGGPRSARLMFPEESMIGQILYPLPAGPRFGEPGAATAALEALLGHQRSAILRMLDRPCSTGAIARRLFLAPGGVTHHLKQLEACGLVARERAARSVVVRRTARGNALLGLYDQGI